MLVLRILNFVFLWISDDRHIDYICVKGHFDFLILLSTPDNATKEELLDLLCLFIINKKSTIGAMISSPTFLTPHPQVIHFNLHVSKALHQQGQVNLQNRIVPSETLQTLISVCCTSQASYPASHQNLSFMDI